MFVYSLDLLQESQFNVELVVQCVRLSLNPQTHHHALLLLSTAAAIFPVSFTLLSLCLCVIRFVIYFLFVFVVVFRLLLLFFGFN